MPKAPSLRITLGAANYTFETVGVVPALIKPFTGELRRATGSLIATDIIDAPLTIKTIRGLGVARATEFVSDPNERAFSEENMMTLFPGLIAIGPLENTSTVPAEVAAVEFKLFAAAFDEFFAAGDGQDAATTADETLLYLDASQNWVDTTLKDDLGNGSSPMNVKAVIPFDGQAYLIYNEGAQCFSARGTALTTWVQTSGSQPIARSSGTQVGSGEVTDGANIWVAVSSVTDSPVGSIIRRSVDKGANWTTRATVFTDQRNARGMVMFTDGIGASAVDDPWVSYSTGLYHIDDSAQTARNRVPFFHPESAYSGQMQLTDNGILLSDGCDLYHVTFQQNGKLFADLLFCADSLPALKRGDITAVSYVSGQNWALAAVGGLDASHKAGVYAIPLSGDHLPHNIYYNSTANRAVFAIGFTTEPSGTPTLVMSKDNATANDSDLTNFVDITRDPRTVSGYTHAASGELVMAKNDLGIPALDATWRRIVAEGSNFSSNNKVTAYHSSDATPIDTDGSWTQLENSSGSGNSITQTGEDGATFFPATPDTTGLAAKAQQLRYKLEGSSNQSPYLETILTHAVKRPPIKWIRTWRIPLTSKGSTQPSRLLVRNLQTIVAGSTDLEIRWGSEPATVMEPYFLRRDVTEGGPLLYAAKITEPGTAGAHFNAKFALLTLVER